MGMRSYQQQRLGNALTWALQSQDAGFATYLASKFLELYSQEGKFHSMDLLDNLGSCMLVSDRLTFLGRLSVNTTMLMHILNLIMWLCYFVCGNYVIVNFRLCDKPTACVSC
jgi:hypothetical protein